MDVGIHSMVEGMFTESFGIVLDTSPYQVVTECLNYWVGLSFNKRIGEHGVNSTRGFGLI